MKSFRELIVWQKAHQLFLDMVKDVEGGNAIACFYVKIETEVLQCYN